MKNIVFQFLFILLPLPSIAQWDEVYKDSTLWDITDIHIFNHDSVVIAGMNVGWNGFYLRTTDGAESWTLATSPDHIGAVQAMVFVNDSTGYSTGKDGFIKRTTNQGVTWNTYSYGPYSIWDPNDLIQVNDSVWLQIGEGVIARSEDSLNTWSVITNVNFKDYIFWKSLHSFHFVDNQTGYALANGIYKTNDQGLTWNLTNADTNYFYNGMHMRDSLSWFAVGNNGILLKSIDGGLHWIKSIISKQHLRDILFINDTIGICVGGGGGDNDYNNGYILTTLDGGITWAEEKVSDRALNTIKCIGSACYIVGGDQIFKLSNYDILSIENVTPTISNLKVWPNPTTNFVEFDLIDNSTNWELKIFDSVGKLILNTNRKNENRVSFENYPNGIYFIQLSSGTQTHVGKVIKN